jgi:nucleoside-diphosphate-sugar epimerase
MHTIFGAGGPVANALTKELLAAGQTVRLVSRGPVTIFENAAWQKADLLNREEVLNAAQGAAVLYLCAGLRYDTKVWAAEWTVIMQNMIAAAESSGARLLFFDNVYAYGLVAGPMKEDTPYHPLSAKGKIRAGIADALMKAIDSGRIKGCIVRAADFYGSESLNSFFDSTVLAKYAKGQKAIWLGNPRCKHSFTYVPDAGKAMALLSQRPEADGQIWHVPTAGARTGKEFLEMAANAFTVPVKYGTVNKFMIKAAGLFNKMMAETAEMWYQYDHDYIFDSSKFEKAFGMKPTPYEEGMKEAAASGMFG